MKDVQCYELFGGIALKNNAFSFSLLFYNRLMRLQSLWKCRCQVERTIGVVPQRIDLEQPEHVCPGFSSLSPARRSGIRRCKGEHTTPVTDKTTASLVCSSVYGRGCFVGLLENTLTRDTTRRLRFDVHAAGWQLFMVLHGRECCGNMYRRKKDMRDS